MKNKEKNPESPGNEQQKAWDSAEETLGNYIDQNLRQVSYIFWLTVFIMVVGFFLIGMGVYKIFSEPTNLTSALLSAVSGIIINFIGATYIVVYRSIMSQTKDYVNILERINAVRISIELLEKISDETLKNRAVADLAKQILLFFSGQKKL